MNMQRVNVLLDPKLSNMLFLAPEKGIKLRGSMPFNEHLEVTGGLLI
jgi:hypothetical protein